MAGALRVGDVNICEVAYLLLVNKALPHPIFPISGQIKKQNIPVLSDNATTRRNGKACESATSRNQSVLLIRDLTNAPSTLATLLFIHVH